MLKSLKDYLIYCMYALLFFVMILIITMLILFIYIDKIIDYILWNMQILCSTIIIYPTL